MLAFAVNLLGHADWQLLRLSFACVLKKGSGPGSPESSITEMPDSDLDILSLLPGAPAVGMLSDSTM